VFGDDGQHLFEAGELFRRRFGRAGALFGVKIFGRQAGWHNDIRDVSISLLATLLELISKMWIRIHGKARFGEKAEHTR